MRETIALLISLFLTLHPLVQSAKNIQTLMASLNKDFISIFTIRNVFRLLRRFWWEAVVYLQRQNLGKALRYISEKSWRVWVSSAEPRRVCSEQNGLSRRNWGGITAFGQETPSYSQKHLGDSWYIIDIKSVPDDSLGKKSWRIRWVIQLILRVKE